MKKLSQPPSPEEVRKKLEKAISNGKPADIFLYEVTKDAKIEVGPVTFKIWPELNTNFKEYSESWLTLTSEKGRKYIHEHLDRLLDYVEYLVKK